MYIFFFHSLQNTKNSAEHNEFIDKIMIYVRCFKCNADVQRYKNLKNLKEYLHYRIALMEYEAEVGTEAVSFKEFCRNYV